MRPKIRRLVVITGASTVLGVAGWGGAASSPPSSSDQSGTAA